LPSEGRETTIDRKQHGSLMETKSIAPLLEESPFFAGMSPEHIDLVAGCGSTTRFEAGSRILREGDPSARFFVIRHGRVCVEVHTPNRGNIVIQTLEEGDLVGFSALFPPYRVHFEARATQLVRALSFDADCLRKKFQVDPEFGFELTSRFSRVMLERLQATRMQLLDIYGNTKPISS
jgi:CRP/FNR family cyclic AMP-dependent transcriptional regulator